MDGDRIFSCLAHVKAKNGGSVLESDELGAYVTIYGLANRVEQFVDLAEDALAEIGFEVLNLDEFLELDSAGQDSVIQNKIDQLSVENRIQFDSFNAYTSEYGFH